MQVEVKKGEDECEKLFNKLSVEERKKFDEETLVNFNNIRKQSLTTHDEVSEGVCNNQYIVVSYVLFQLVIWLWLKTQMWLESYGFLVKRLRSLWLLAAYINCHRLIKVNIWRLPCKSLHLSLQTIFWCVKPVLTCFLAYKSWFFLCLFDNFLIILQAAEGLWTPQKENDCLTEQEMLENYPMLRRL